MEANQPAARDGHHPAASPSNAHPASPASDQHSEDLFVRNYDIERTYHLRLTAVHDADDERLERQYTLQPGQVIAEFGILPSGQYELRVEIAHTGTDGTCTVGTAPDETALVEVGNGTVSISQGLY